MSVFSDINHTPARIHAVMRLLDAIGEPASRKTLADLMLPHVAAEKRESADLINNTLRVAVDLGLIDQEQQAYRALKTAPANYGKFADLCYDRFLAAVAPDDNAILIDALACIAHLTDREGMSDWFTTINSGGLQVRVEPLLSAARNEATTFNASRVPPFRRWLTALQLATVIGSETYYLDITGRLHREIARDPAFAAGERMAARDFLAWARRRLPFLPGGARARALNLTGGAEHEADVLLSQALRNLHGEDFLVLEVQGDSSTAVAFKGRLPHRIQSFMKITIPKQAVA